MEVKEADFRISSQFSAMFAWVFLPFLPLWVPLQRISWDRGWAFSQSMAQPTSGSQRLDFSQMNM